MHKTLEEMQELAVKTFGEGATVSYDGGSGWIIHTEIEESPFSWEGLEDTPAYLANQEDYNGETTLERWGLKNGHGWSSMRELVEAYNDSERQSWGDYLESCRKFLRVRGVEVPEDDNELMDKAQDELDKLVESKVE